MATITNLDVNLLARTKKFDKPIKKSSKTFGKFSKGISSFNPAKLIGGFIAIAGAALTVAAGMRKVNEQFDNIDRLGKFADEVDSNVKSLQALELQAKLTGTSQETMTKGIQRFTRILGDARQGEQEAVDGLAQMGLTAASFNGLNLSEQMALVADKINSSGDAADRASAAYGVFGRQGQQLMTFFAGGGEGIAKAADDIDRFGVGLSRVDAAQVEMANDAFTRLDAMMDGVFQKIAVELAPILTATVEMFTDGAAAGGGFGNVIEKAFSILVEGIAFAMNGWNVFMGAWRGGQALVTTIIGGILGGLGLIEKALIKFGGSRFDFGIQGMANDVIKEGERLGKESAKRFGAGFSGDAGRAFKDKINEVKARADAFAPKEPLPIIETPTPLDLKAIWNNVSGAGLKAFDYLANNLPPIEAKAVTGPGAAPSVGAVAQGSAAALSAILSANRGENDPVMKAARLQVEATEKQTKELTKKTQVGIVIDDPFI